MAAARGRRPKGDREPMHVRVPRDHKRLYEQEAAKAGLFVGDYIAVMLARAHDLPEPDYLPQLHEERLPLGA